MATHTHFIRSSYHPTRRRFLTGAAALALPGWLAASVNEQGADMVLSGGEIHTVDVTDRRVSALAIAGGRIVATGTDQAMKQYIGADTRRVDLAGRTVLPGINDSHLHLLIFALSQPPYSLDLTYPTVESIADVKRAVAQAAATRPQNEWIIGRGWDQAYLSEGRAPVAADLDAVAPEHPVVLTDFSGHAVWVNSRVLALAGIGADTVPAPGGVIVRDDTGRATGVLFEGPAFDVRALVPAPDPAQKKAAVYAAMQVLLARGITSATDPRLEPADIEIYNEIASVSGPKIRMNGLLGAGTSATQLRDALERFARIERADPAWMQVTGVKIMGDGIPTANKTAWLHEPYVGGGNGSLLLDGETDEARVAELNEMIRLIHTAGLQAGTHATGDRAIDEVVAACEAAQLASPRNNPRHYLIHADLVSEATLARMARLGIGANFNPEIKYLIADSQVQSIGPSRASYEWPYRSALRAGVQLASSSDAPVAPGHWLQGLATCVERKGKQSGAVSGTEQRISLDQAIRSYTWAAAWQDHAEHFKGSLEAGKVADLCVLDERLSSVAPGQYARTRVAMAMVDGKLVYGGI